jgi:hypothetical protein
MFLSAPTKIKREYDYKGSGGNEKFPPRMFSTVGIVLKLPLTPNTTNPQTSPPWCGAVCPSYGVVSLDTPDTTRVTSSEGVGRGHIRWV